MAKKDLADLKEHVKELLDIEEEALHSLFSLAAKHGLKIDLEFQDQKISMGDHTIKLNGKTVVRGEKEEVEQ
ncbi:MAG: hypothetical protein SVV03_01960 [Candidatus Nanohaloarchaea archaeon]|nr:hypothetical protein [Candidatus Nanohaloarchaea archaeon]